MAKILCVLYDDPTTGYTSPAMLEMFGSLSPHRLIIHGEPCLRVNAEPLRKGPDFTLYRGWHLNPSPVLVVAGDARFASRHFAGARREGLAQKLFFSKWRIRRNCAAILR